MAFNFAPRGWAFCDGQLLPISQNQALYSLLGTTFGGDGRTSFALPDFRGRVPIHAGPSADFPLGARGGEDTHTLTAAEMPSHDHALQATSSAAELPIPSGALLANSATDLVYHEPANMVDMSPEAVSQSGGGQPHDNRMPLLGLRFCIALQGLFPPRS